MVRELALRQTERRLVDDVVVNEPAAAHGGRLGPDQGRTSATERPGESIGPKWRSGRWALWAIVVAGLVVRFYGIHLPLVDSLHLRQTQTAMVARNLYRDGLTFWMTRYDIFGNTPGYAILEFPLVNTIAALLYVPLGVHEVIGRLISVAFWLGSVFWMLALARRFLSEGWALMAMAIYTGSLTGIFMSRAYMPESAMMFFLLGAMVVVLRWVERPTFARGTLAAVLAALCFLVKSPTALLAIPAAVAWLSRYGKRGILRWEPYAVAGIAVIPALLWNLHASRVNATYVPMWRPESFLLERGGGLAVRLSAEFYWMIGRSLVALMTPIGLLLALVGGFKARGLRSFLPLKAWLLAWVGFVFVLAEINMWHPYYQLPMLPPAAIIGAGGAAWLLSRVRTVSWQVQRRWLPAWGTAALALGLAQLGACAYFFIDSYDIKKRVPNHLEVAQILRENTPSDAVLVLNDLNEGSSTTLIYYADRRAWSLPVEQGEKAVRDLEALRAQGGTVYAAVDSVYYQRVDEVVGNDALWRHLNGTYRPIRITDGYLIFDLSQPLSGSR